MEYKRKKCVRCNSTNLDRKGEVRDPLVLGDKTIRWYRRKCKECGQVFVTKES